MNEIWVDGRDSAGKYWSVMAYAVDDVENVPSQIVYLRGLIRLFEQLGHTKLGASVWRKDGSPQELEL